MNSYGLIGKNISYSFSKAFFEDFFNKKNLPHTYTLFDIESISEFPEILAKNTSLKGLNVTIPYKQQILPYLDKIDKEAKKIGAVNTIKINKNGLLVGYNTDHFGFATSLAEHLSKQIKSALILGTGGASKAVAYVLDNLNIHYQFVSRNPEENELAYENLTNEIIANHKLIINCTPLGTSPNINAFPKIPYGGIGHEHLLFDLIYNPQLTIFLKMGKDRGAKIVNGEAMLEYQAKKSWKIWN
ncbi:MAG: shikimate dehydrogenase [Flavobacteriaceae bacterium CG_4_8_14_3_um_filter_34_10]|nr:shikimate dehydrogenase [Flavobacteriia bacterium]OIP50459.1 MAG: shikimate dehydrogenase [Flavobacteriaceae bacterium CG2_30_34_30]PIQ18231.1 MAG: shikimate dehydrogenase [Flavobacteriaceae bacterium CG18_big_fil_WC_8_21_14_2_50_34_36]PIV49686.1 MAG: shikimate dehydrogenase [Flavobacteriaceae bacterium CG02_land_8_20_14_3_00_34_13]PIX08738.1 MAG: shikimate dehydrogenase [Flavobacteriaceae bacterium CG_4_8_14_3_um_filter_34_10]PIZ09059.1 MAG: shikimate dehydrogenase [Flavobacteriaceae bacte